MRVMSAEAIGEYFRALVELQPGLSLASVSRAAGVQPNYLSRLGVPGENGTKEPSGRVLLGLLRAAHGKIEHLEEILYSDTATAEQGRLLAEKTLNEMKAAPTENERRQVLQRLIADLESNPQKIDQLIGYGARLREEDRAGR